MYMYVCIVSTFLFLCMYSVPTFYLFPFRVERSQSLDFASSARRLVFLLQDCLLSPSGQHSLPACHLMNQRRGVH
uniref:Uncharacterized protein n=1 Tax=Amphimedon queenslandica TaxID=400682 RepID=A0A1X7VFP8_AMPQE